MFNIFGTRKQLWALAVTLVFSLAGVRGTGQSSQVPATPRFEQDIVPIFEHSCASCHISASMGKLRLDSEAALLHGGASGPAIVPGHSSDSLLVKRLLGLTDGPRMPMGGQ